MAIKIGEINELTVKRETDISYTLTDGYEDFFLHFNQTPNPLQIGEKVKAFLYYDQKKRLCATLEQPFITATKYGLVKVVNIHGDAGVLWISASAKIFCFRRIFCRHPKNCGRLSGMKYIAF